MPETDAKAFSTVLLQKYGVGSIKITNKGTTRSIEVPDPGSKFPQANSNCGIGVSREEIALTTRTSLQTYHPDKLSEKVERYHAGRGVGVDLTPPYMPSFQPIELFWQQGKQYVSFKFETCRTIKQVWEQVRLGWYGDLSLAGHPDGWKPANCGNLVTHAGGEMDKWIANDSVLKGSIRKLETPEGYDQDDVPDKTILEDDGVQAQMESDELEGLADLHDQSEENLEV